MIVWAVGVATVTAPRFHYGTGCPFFVQVSFAAAIDSFAEDDVYFTFGRSSVLNVTTASPTSYGCVECAVVLFAKCIPPPPSPRYIVEINPGVNSTIGVQIIDKDHWPVPEWSPSNVSSVYYVAPGTEFSSASLFAASALEIMSSSWCLCFCAMLSGFVTDWRADRVPLRKHYVGVYVFLFRSCPRV
jgi:hypothetical protein